ncbi:MAG: hypothetical protein GY730_01340, partial [bacterium]|nr:hypothetical protein [bacterium]
MTQFPPIQYIKGIGPGISVLFKKLGIHSVKDFMYYFPRAYDDRRFIAPISELKTGEIQMCVGTIENVVESKGKSRVSIIKCNITDRRSSIAAVWFNQKFIKKKLQFGKLIIFKRTFKIKTFTVFLNFCL